MKVSTRAVLHFTAKAGPWRAACDSNFLNVSGTVVDPGLDRNEFANDQTVVYVSTSIDETIELPSTLAIVAGDIPDDVLVSIPFASVAMKILRAIEPVLGFGAKTVKIEYSTDGTKWTQLANVPEFARAPGQDGYVRNTTVSFGGVLAKFVRLTIEKNWGVTPQTGLSEVRFFSIPTASTPKP